MKEILAPAVKMVHANLPMVILVGIFDVRFMVDGTSYLSLVGFLASFLIGLVVYGRIAAQVQGERPRPGMEIIKANWINYVVVLFLLGAPFVVLQLISVQVQGPHTAWAIARGMLELLVSIVTIYVLPIVFLKGKHAIAVIAGVAYLFQRLRQSAPIVLLSLAAVMVNLGTAFSFLYIAGQLGGTFAALLPALALSSVVTAYLSFLVFAAASVVLVGRRC